MDAPERIWAIEFSDGSKTWTDNHALSQGRVEYVRADLFALAAVAMREAATMLMVKHVEAAQREGLYSISGRLDEARFDIARLPILDHAALLRAALQLREVRAAREKLQQMVDYFNQHEAGIGSDTAMGNLARAALAALEGKQ